MKIFIKTKVESSLEKVHSKFNQDLFEKLAPPLVDLTVDRFDGCLKGHEVHLSMTSFGLMKSKWISKITTSELNANEFYFIDEGDLLPPPLKKWKHVHRVEKIDNNSCYVIDDIDFTTNSTILDNIIYPALFAMFKHRSPIYKRELS
jgi:ligand-binding SRPBCC domain-containing protein